MRMVVVEKATDVRKDFSRFLTKVVHGGPAFLQRNRDEIAAISLEQLELLLKPFSLTMEYAVEQDGSVSGSLREIDLVGSASDINQLRYVLARELVDYAQDYMANFELYYHAPNRRDHLPYVLKVILQDDVAAVASLINA